MKYIIIPAEKYEQADKQLAEKLGLANPRRSVDGSEIVMHTECYERLFGSTGRLRSKAAYPVYDSEDSAFDELMRSTAWTSPEETNG